jgi:NAD kinase
MRIKALFNEKDPRQERYIRFMQRAFPEIIDEENPDMYYIIGGDGSMMHGHKNVSDKSLPFFGKGFGTLNFIMNNFENDFTIIEGLLNDTIKPSVIETIKINVSVITKTGSFNTSCINDIVIGGDIMDYNRFTIDSLDKSFDNFSEDGTGICVSTPLGSTAFNLNNKGAVLPIGSDIWSITSIACNRNINEIVTPQKIVFVVESERSNPVVYIDGRANYITLRKGDSVEIEPSSEKFKIAFLSLTEFNAKRIKLVQERR